MSDWSNEERLDSRSSLPLANTFIQPVSLDKISTSSLDGLLSLIDTRLSPPVVLLFQRHHLSRTSLLLDCDSIRRKHKGPSTVGEQDRAGEHQ